MHATLVPCGTRCALLYRRILRSGTGRACPHESPVSFQFPVQHDCGGHSGEEEAAQGRVEHRAGIALGAEPQCAGRMTRLQNHRSNVEPAAGRDPHRLSCMPAAACSSPMAAPPPLRFRFSRNSRRFISFSSLKWGHAQSSLQRMTQRISCHRGPHLTKAFCIPFPMTTPSLASLSIDNEVRADFWRRPANHLAGLRVAVIARQEAAGNPFFVIGAAEGRGAEPVHQAK